jgi:hypothetical protein
VLGGRRADVIVVEASPDDAATLRATVNGKVVSTRPADSVTRVEVLAGPGGDEVTVALGEHAGAIAVHVDGGRGRDRIVGGDGDDKIEGGPGADLLSGGGGNDELLGGPGNDDLSGGEGADRISGGRGRDRIHRQGGVDTAAGDRRDVFGSDRGASTLTRLLTDEALRQWLVDAAVRQYAWAFGQPAWGWAWRADAGGNVYTSALSTNDSSGGAPAGAPEVLTSAGGAVGSGFSKTNVQVEGVDEADLVETDGDFIYTLRAAPFDSEPPSPGTTGSPVYNPVRTQLVIADAVPADAMSVTSRTAVDGAALGMYLIGTRLAVVTQSYPAYPPYLEVGAPVRFTGIDGTAIVDPGDPTVKVTVFDVSDRAAPRVVEQTTLDGSYDSSRAIGDRVYVILRNDTWAPAPATLDAEPDAGDVSGTEPGAGTGTGTGIVIGTGAKVYESEASYRDRLEKMPLADLLPGYSAEAGDVKSSGSLVRAPDVFVKDVDAPVCGQNMTTVAVLNVGDDAAGPSGTTSVAGWAGTAYASTDSLYMATAFWEPGETPADPGRSGTNLFKFELGPDSVPLAATGEVGGVVLNQFSMDERDGDLRIATATNPNVTVDPTDPEAAKSATTVVTVMRQDGEDLKPVGAASGLAPGERFSSARFVGDMVYLTTYKVVQTRPIDPLLAIDLRDPSRPKVVGELKIPGFSSYLQPIGDDLLVGVGRDTTDDGQTLGLQISLFDVSNPARPVRLAAHSFGDAAAWQWSEAESNHLAFSYFPEQHVLALPVYSQTYRWGVTEDNTGGDAAPEPYALEVFRVGREDGIQPLGAVTSESVISRSLRIGAAIFAVGPDEIRAAQLDSPETLLGKLSLRSSDETTGTGAGG